MRPASGESECLLSETNRTAMYTLHYGPEHFVAREFSWKLTLNFDILFTRSQFGENLGNKFLTYWCSLAWYSKFERREGGWRNSNNLIIMTAWSRNKVRRIDIEIAARECVLTRKLTSRGLGDRKHRDYQDFHCRNQKSIAARCYRRGSEARRALQASVWKAFKLCLLPPI